MIDEVIDMVNENPEMEREAATGSVISSNASPLSLKVQVCFLTHLF